MSLISVRAATHELSGGTLTMFGLGISGSIPPRDSHQLELLSIVSPAHTIPSLTFKDLRSVDLSSHFASVLAANASA